MATTISGTTITFSDSTTQVTSANTRSYGVGQTWASYVGSRSFGVTYYNTTGKPIAVSVRLSGYNGSCLIYVDGVLVSNGYGYNNVGEANAYATVPVGSSYSVSGGGLSTWAELR
jgi:hypothetical protein